MTKLTFILFCPLYTHEFHFSNVIAHMSTTHPVSCHGHKVQRDEAYMWLTMADYIENHSDGINLIAGDFLKCKGQTFDDYLEFIRVPGNKGNEYQCTFLCA